MNKIMSILLNGIIWLAEIIKIVEESKKGE